MADERLKQEVDEYVDEVWEDVVEDIRSLVRIRSVEDLSHATAADPWGPACHRALRQALAIAERLGLEAHDCEGRIGYADLPGRSERYLATICHADVVPEGRGWTFDPFDVTRKDACLVGRGVLDDKGPLVLSLYAAHFFVRRALRTGERLPLTLRAIVGSEEETSMRDVAYYLERHPQPEFLFTPDADFPLICGEKGVFQGRFCSVATVGGHDAPIESMDGGTVPNAVCGRAEAVVRVRAADLPGRERIDVTDLGDGRSRVVARGVGGHASLPEGTLNAIGLLWAYLLDAGVVPEELAPFAELELRLCAQGFDGSSLGVACSNDRFGPLTLIGGTLRTEGGHLVQTCDCRYPDAIDAHALERALARQAQARGASFVVTGVKPPFHIDPESPELRCLLDTYDEFRGTTSRAKVIGGGTYARKFMRACAFGPHEPADPLPSWAGPEHGADEAIGEGTLRRALKIYIVSISRLMRLHAQDGRRNG
ncbi:Sapep family Mn(2+)-dependent dipeptidase [Olsenella massiliensis]|uniref:Sapep family Mn(2+)-dependent dipeptidase n=1 Tax=Olsenella massiliensis TaxID=1622075 RepID=UPI00071E5D0D|nr:Sapep family Mn(2+)-dependent dipeptidase [Olsenella massiliensis]